MSTWISVARYQLTDRYVVVIAPWLILSLGFPINLVIVVGRLRGRWPAATSSSSLTGR